MVEPVEATPAPRWSSPSRPHQAGRWSSLSRPRRNPVVEPVETTPDRLRWSSPSRPPNPPVVEPAETTTAPVVEPVETTPALGGRARRDHTTQAGGRARRDHGASSDASGPGRGRARRRVENFSKKFPGPLWRTPFSGSECRWSVLELGHDREHRRPRHRRRGAGRGARGPVPGRRRRGPDAAGGGGLGGDALGRLPGRGGHRVGPRRDRDAGRRTRCTAGRGVLGDRVRRRDRAARPRPARPTSARPSSSATAWAGSGPG